MLGFIIKRLLFMIPSLMVVSFLAFVLIQLPPGDYVTTYIATLAASNELVERSTCTSPRPPARRIPSKLPRRMLQSPPMTTGKRRLCRMSRTFSDRCSENARIDKPLRILVPG